MSSLAGTVAAQPLVVESNLGEERWFDRDDPIVLTLDRLPTSSEGRLVVFIGNMDVTSLVRQSGTELRYEPTPLRLPRGRHDVVVYVVRDESWNEIASLPLQVFGRLGIRESSADLRVDLSVDSQLDEHHSRDAGPPDEERYVKLNGNAGLSTGIVVGKTKLASNLSTVFGSRRRDALRFSEKGSDAPRIDLADYQIDLEREGTKIQLGHIGFGSQRHLVSGLSRRGVKVSQEIGLWADVSATVMSGQRIVGVENISGVQDPNALLGAVTIGLNPIDRDAFRARIETSGLWSRVEKLESNFNTGQIRDSESSRGIGLTLSGDAWGRRVRYSGSWARSSFKNENDRELFFGFDVVAAKRETADAYYAEIELDLLRDQSVLSDYRVSATISGGFEQVAPLYRSLGAFVSADQRQFRLGGTFDVAGVGMRIGHDWSRDNLDRVPGVLVTRTRDLSFDLAIPVVNFVPEDTPMRSLVPSLQYSLRRTDQKAVNGGIVFAPSAIPSQLSTTHTLSTDWFFAQWSIGYNFTQSIQDNRQVGRETADLRRRTHSLSIDFQPIETLNLRAGTSFTRQEDFEFDIAQSNFSIDGGLTWRFLPSWTISADASYSLDSDSQNEIDSSFNSVNARLVKEFEIPLPRIEKRRGRVFVAFNRQLNKFQDNFADFRTSAETWVLTAGASISLF